MEWGRPLSSTILLEPIELRLGRRNRPTRDFQPILERHPLTWILDSSRRGLLREQASAKAQIYFPLGRRRLRERKTTSRLHCVRPARASRALLMSHFGLNARPAEVVRSCVLREDFQRLTDRRCWRA